MWQHEEYSGWRSRIKATDFSWKAGIQGIAHLEAVTKGPQLGKWKGLGISQVLFDGEHWDAERSKESNPTQLLEPLYKPGTRGIGKQQPEKDIKVETE